MQYYTVISCLFGEVKTAAPICHGQLDALLPEAEKPRAMVHRAVHSTIPPWNNCFITQPLLKISVLSQRNACLIGTRRRYTQLTS